MKPDIAKIISWIFLILGTIFFVWKLVGGSPTEFTTIMAFLMAITFNLVSVNSKIAKLEERSRNMELKFTALASDFKEHIKHK